jgi:DNA-binding NtrC family response regulator
VQFIPADDSGKNELPGTKEARSAQAHELQAIRILVVDDDDSFRRALIANLREATYLKLEPRGTQTGESAVEIVSNEPDSIDWILLDLNLPKMNGLDTYREIRKSNQKVGMILMTSAVRGTTARAAIKDGLTVFDKYTLSAELERLLLESSGETNQ